jgi:chemotaxis protein methyltransferase CheR
MQGISPIREEEFDRFRRLIYEVAGISMAPQKKMLVASRLAKRLNHYGLNTYGDYYRLATSANFTGEFQVMIDLLTTNETYFFREPQHFDFLEQSILKKWRGERFRIWSAACSSGEEVYTLSMKLAEHFSHKNWEVLGSDISSRMLDSCRRAVYPMTRLQNMPEHFLKKYCLKGVRQQEGMIMIDRSLRERCRFMTVNLMESLPDIGKFEVIFIRNVMIYFDMPTKKAVVDRITRVLNPGGYLIISHSETLHGISKHFKMIKPSIYQLLPR